MQFNSSSVSNGYSASSSVEPEMTEERRQYLLEKEEMINKRNNNKKTFGIIIVASIVLGLGVYLYNNYFKHVEIDSRIDKKSIHYVTDLYYSDGRYYEEYLDEGQKKMYLNVLNDLKDVNSKTVIDCRDYGYSSKGVCGGYTDLIIDIVLMEHPDLFWYRSSDYSYRDDSEVTIRHHYVSTNKIQLYFVEKRLLIKIDELTKKFEDKSEFEKVKAVYTWLGETTTYSTLMTRKSGTAWSALLSDDSVCAGFAAASQLLFQRLGIESQVVVGGYDGVGHAWNFVEIDNEYYWYDSTVAGSASKDSGYFYTGLCLTNNSKYSPAVIDMKKYQFGTKYIGG
jgi:hypothetical protein